jgi:hypothetical protein
MGSWENVEPLLFCIHKKQNDARYHYNDVRFIIPESHILNLRFSAKDGNSRICRCAEFLKIEGMQISIMGTDMVENAKTL